jgi:hypothetical protein
MRAPIFALLLSQSWIGVFSYYSCNGYVGSPCNENIKCCDDISSGNFVWCVRSVGSPYGVYAGPGRCPTGGVDGWCVAVANGLDYCSAGRPVLLLIDVTNFCLLVKSTAASHFSGSTVFVRRLQPQKGGCRHRIVVEMERSWIALTALGCKKAVRVMTILRKCV